MIPAAELYFKPLLVLGVSTGADNANPRKTAVQVSQGNQERVETSYISDDRM